MHLEDSSCVFMYVSLTHPQDSIEMDNAKNRIFITLIVIGLLAACQAPGISADSAEMFTKPDKNWLIVGSNENGCPLDVFSLGRTCDPDKADDPNVSCQDKSAIIRWYPLGKPIKIIWTTNPTTVCRWKSNQEYYQCTLSSRVKSGDVYDYKVVVNEDDVDCGMDPRIIIK